jgi:hypothetical protein
VFVSGVASFVDWWTLCWTLVLVLGYVADLTPWPRLRVLRSPGCARTMLILSTALVLGFTLGGDTRSSAVMAAWAIVFASVNWLYHYFTSLE